MSEASNVVPIRNFTISVGISADRGKVKPLTLTWEEFSKRFTTPFVDAEVTSEEYHANKAAQGDLKAKPGFFLGGSLKSGSRLAVDCINKCIVTLDIDDASPELMSEVFSPFDGPLSGFAYAAHTTRSHLPEKPKLRIAIPLATTVDIDTALVITRFLARAIDKNMRTVDRVSFRAAQIMYWSSINSDGAKDFRAFVNEGKAPLDPKRFLAAVKWDGKLESAPLHHLEDSPVRSSALKLGDPREKPGLIGAFNQAYDIPAAIQAFIPDAYEKVDDNRYRWLGGSSGSGGALTFDDGWGELRIYSNHGTDPGYMQSLHPYDMVRVHKFGHLDEKERDPRTGKYLKEVTSRASFKAMADLVIADEKCRPFVADKALDPEALANDSAFDVPEDAPTLKETLHTNEGLEVTSDDPSWRMLLDRTEKGDTKKTHNNIAIILKYHGAFRDCFAYNEMLECVVLVKPIKSKVANVHTGPIKDTTNGDRFNDWHITQIQNILSSPRKREGKSTGGLGLGLVGREEVDNQVSLAAWNRKFHPIKRYLKGLSWDGVPRVATMLTTYCGAEDTPLNRDIALKFMLGAIARTMQPGCKFDFALVFKSQQGGGKSTFISTMGGQWSKEVKVGFDDPIKFAEAIRGAWWIELPELSQFRKNEIEEVKAGVSATHDHYRPPYARTSRTFLRQCVMAGSTNQNEFLRDDENRRFWVVDITGKEVDVTSVERDRDQLFAEAYRAWAERWLDHDESLSPWLDLSLAKENRAALAAVHEKHKVDDGAKALAELIEAFLDRECLAAEANPGYRITDGIDTTGEFTLRDRVIFLDIAYHVLNLGVGEYLQRGAGTRILKAMRLVPGWSPSASKIRAGSFGLQRYWFRTKANS